MAVFTDSPHWQDFIRRDELALHRVSVDFLRGNLRLTTGLFAQAGQLRGPVLFLLAGRDQICDNDTTLEFVRRMTQAQVTLKEYPQACHTLEFEDEPLPHVADLLDWLGGVGISPPR